MILPERFCLVFSVLSALIKQATAQSPLCSEPVSSTQYEVSNVAVPTSISTDGIRELRLANFLENLEVSFFSAGMQNTTNWDMDWLPENAPEIIDSIASVRIKLLSRLFTAKARQQEVVHLSSIEQLLGFYNATITPPCNYSFPVSTSREFVELGHAIASAGIGAVVGIAERLAKTDPLLLNIFSSILPIESRHDAFFRSVEGAIPNPTPFETGISGIWAYNLALAFIEPGSCSEELPLPVFSRLGVSGHTLQSVNQTHRQRDFSWDPTQTPFTLETGKQLFVGWVSQLGGPVYTPLNVTAAGRGTSCMPPGLSGTVFVVVTAQKPENVDDLVLSSLAGPAVVSLS